MDRAKFFSAVRTSVFGGSLSQSQVKGMEAILDACTTFSVNDSRHVAYILATPMIETGGSFEPIVESLNYSATALRSKFPNRISQSQASQYGRTAAHPADQKAIGNIIYGGTWGRANLGNVDASDGYAFRGRGLVQLTGRRLYTIASKLTGVDLVANPDLACDLADAAKVMVIGMRDGIFTGKKLSDYFSAGAADWVNARRIVNGTDRAADIAAFAQKFEMALNGAGYGKDAAVVALPKPPVDQSLPIVSQPKTSLLAAIANALIGLMGRKAA